MNFKDSKHPCWAQLNQEGMILFGDIFPDGMVPVYGLQTGLTNLEGIGENEVRIVAMMVLDQDIREKLLEKVARRQIPESSKNWLLGMADDWIRDAKIIILSHGLPLRESLVEGWVLKDPMRWVA